MSLWNVLNLIGECVKCQNKRRHAHWKFPEPTGLQLKNPKGFSYNRDETVLIINCLSFISQKCKNSLVPAFSLLQIECMWVLFGYKKQMRDKSCLLFKSKYVHSVCVGGWRWAMEWRLCWSFHSISMFMHSCLCAMCFHAWHCICTVYLHVYLNSIYGLKKGRPAASWSNWQVNHVSVGRLSVCVFVKDPWLISRGSVWPWESCPPHLPAPTHHWREDRVSLSWREIGSQESEPQSYHIE